MPTRRQFLKAGAMAGAGLMMYKAALRTAYPFAQTPTNLRKFYHALPGLGPTGKNEIGQYLPVATPNTRACPGADFYRIIMGQHRELLHPDLPGPTKLWGYADGTNTLPNFKYLGGVIAAKRNRPVRIQYLNLLPNKHILPVDKTIMGAEPGQHENRTVPHLHGGLVPWTSDGGPFAWFTPLASPFFPKTHGVDWQPGDYSYPNEQSARLMWYHDHALGITRLNAYAGLASAYLLTDDVESGLVNSAVIPSRQVPLVIQDKTFKRVADQWGAPGDLWYPSVYEKDSQLPPGSGRWAYGPDELSPAVIPNGVLPVPSCVPEFFADTSLVNGACYPYLKVEPRRYRFRVLNGCQARFLNLQLYYADSATGKEADLTNPGPAFIQIGTEGGFLPKPVVLNDPPMEIDFDSTGNANSYTLLMAPGERADIIIDFSSCPVGANLILYSDAPSPFPMGDSRNDYFTGDPDQSTVGGAPSTAPGYGPNTRTLMQFRMVPLSGSPDPYNFAETLSLLNTALPIAYAASQPPDLSPSGLTPLGKTLNEDFDDYGRLLQTVGTTTQNGTNNQGLPTWGRAYTDPATETPHNHETQVWHVFNLTGDTHPIHWHLVNVQILARHQFDAVTPDFNPANFGPEMPVDDNEKGWKETVRANPGEVLTVIMKFDAPAPPPWHKMKISPRTGGYEYVWHCHILEHEEHDMMRPLVVT